MPPANEKPPEVKTLEDALKLLRERDDELSGERDERKKRGEEASELRKRLRQAEEAAAQERANRERDSQKTLEEQGRYRDLYENERRAREQIKQERDDFEKKYVTKGQELEGILGKLSHYEKRETDRVEARFARLPEELRKAHGNAPAETKDAIADTYERTVGVRGNSIAPALSPPSGLPPSGQFIREEDLEAMTHQERTKFYKSGDFDRAVREGRFLKKGQHPGPR